MNPLVSIIIPCYNSSKYLSETLLNILSQTYPNFECILVDDGSTDDTSKTAKEFMEKDKRIRYYYQKNSGVSTARNTGIKFANGDFIQFLDADDIIHPEKLNFQTNYLLAHKSVDIIYGDYILFNKLEDINFSSNKKNDLTKKQDWEKTSILNYLVRDNIISIHSALSRRKVIETNIFDPAIKNCEDYDFWFNSALSGFHFKYLNNQNNVCYYRKHYNNKSSNSPRMNYYRSYIKQKYLTKIKEKEPELYKTLYNGFILNHKKYLFGKSGKRFSDISYTLKLACKYISIKLFFITIEYLIIPNYLWRLVYWNGGIIKYLKIKLK